MPSDHIKRCQAADDFRPFCRALRPSRIGRRVGPRTCVRAIKDVVWTPCSHLALVAHEIEHSSRLVQNDSDMRCSGVPLTSGVYAPSVGQYVFWKMTHVRQSPAVMHKAGDRHEGVGCDSQDQGVV